MKTIHPFLVWALGISWLLFPFSGCGSGVGVVPVEGKVTFDNQPLEEGEILLQPLDAGMSVGAQIVQGVFRLTEDAAPVEGRYQVEISAYRLTGETVEDPVDGDWEVSENIIPSRYNSDSQLTVEIKRSQPEPLVFALTSD